MDTSQMSHIYDKIMMTEENIHSRYKRFKIRKWGPLCPPKGEHMVTIYHNSDGSISIYLPKGANVKEIRSSELGTMYRGTFRRA